MARSELNTIEQHKTERRKPTNKQVAAVKVDAEHLKLEIWRLPLDLLDLSMTTKAFYSSIKKKILGCTLTFIHIPMPQHCLVCLCCWQTDVLCEAFITFSGAYCNMKDVLISDIDKNLWYLRMCARFGCLTDFVWVLCAQTYKRAEILSKMIWVCLSSSLWACENGSLCRTMTVIPKQLM